MTLFFFIEVRPAHLGGAAPSCSHFFSASRLGRVFSLNVIYTMITG